MKKMLQNISNLSTVMLISLAVVSIVLLIIQGVLSSRTNNTESDKADITQPSVAEKLTDSIAIPGFETLSLKARQISQKVNFYNPSRNNCYFEITVCLESGEELFHSGLLAPGKTIEEIKLNYPLEPGTYENTTITYTCYAIGSMEKLNGANILFDLEVIQ